MSVQNKSLDRLSTVQAAATARRRTSRPCAGTSPAPRSRPRRRSRRRPPLGPGLRRQDPARPPRGAAGRQAAQVKARKAAEQTRLTGMQAESNRLKKVLAARARAAKIAAAGPCQARGRCGAAARRAKKRYVPPPPERSGGYLSAPSGAPVSSEYGMRYHPVLHYWRLHAGRDYAANCGQPIYAAASGTIISAGVPAATATRSSSTTACTAVSPGDHVQPHEPSPAPVATSAVARSSATSARRAPRPAATCTSRRVRTATRSTRASGSDPARTPARNAPAAGGSEQVALHRRGIQPAVPHAVKAGQGSGQGAGAQARREQPQGAPRLPHRGHLRGGPVLTGTEVKSLRMGRASLVDGYATFYGDELWLEGVHIPEYLNGTWTNHTPRRRRKAPQPGRAEQAGPEDARERPHDRAPRAVLHGGPCQGRDRRGEGQEGLRQAARAARAPGPARGTARAPLAGKGRLSVLPAGECRGPTAAAGGGSGRCSLWCSRSPRSWPRPRPCPRTTRRARSTWTSTSSATARCG